MKKYLFLLALATCMLGKDSPAGPALPGPGTL